MNRHINKVAVVGSGIMGSGIACHFANIGVQVLLLDIVPFELSEEEQKKKFPIWLIIVIAIVLIIICACIIGIYFIDANDMWCQILGFLFNAVSPGSCP